MGLWSRDGDRVRELVKGRYWCDNDKNRNLGAICM